MTKCYQQIRLGKDNTTDWQSDYWFTTHAQESGFKTNPPTKRDLP